MPSSGTSIPYWHAQSDNLSLASLVDVSHMPPPGAALRWRPRFAAGLPPELTVYARNAVTPPTVAVDLTRTVEWSGYIRWARTSDGVPIQTDSAGFHLPQGKVRIQFGQPVVSVDLFSDSQSGLVLADGSALHCPFAVAPLVASSAPGSLGRFDADVIDALEINVVQAGTLARLVLVTVRATQSRNWSAIARFSWTSGHYPGARNPRFVEQRRLVAALFDPADPLPMAQRSLSASGFSGSISIPDLALLLLSSYGPENARQFGLLLQPGQTGAGTTRAWDYAVVGNWTPRRRLAGTPTLDFVRIRRRRPANLGTLYRSGGLVLSSAELMRLVAPRSARATGGLLLGKYPTMVYFSTPVQAVEFGRDPSAGDPITVAAFSNTDEPFGQRLVDSVEYDRGTFAAVEADRIDAVFLFGPGAVLRYLHAVAADPALAHAPSAAIGAVTALSFAAQGHPLPAAPGPVVVTTLPDPVLLPGNSTGTPLPPRSDAEAKVGIRFAGVSPGPTLDYRPCSYVISRGPDARRQNKVLAPRNQPLVITEEESGTPATTNPPPAQDPWTGTTSVADSGPATPYYFIDTVDLSSASGSTVEVYAVRAMDIFGRLSAPADSAATSIGGQPPPAPFNVAVNAGDPPPPAGGALPTTLHVTWSWPPDPALATEADIQGFKIYVGPAQSPRPWTDGAVLNVSEAAAGDPPVPNDLPVFHLSAQLDAGATIDVGTLPMASARIGDDHYLLCDGTLAATGELALRVYVNLSTPDERPVAGDAVRIFAGAPDPNLLPGAAAYSQGFATAAATARAADLQIAAPGQGAPFAWPDPDQSGVSRISIGVSAYGETGESAVSGPVPASYVSTASTPPPVPTEQSEDDQFTEPPDAFGRCRYSYPALVLPSGRYHVYRALDEMLLAVKSAATAGTLSAPATPYPSPLVDADFQSAIDSTVTDPGQLTNLQLHALANLSGVETAFEQITSDAVSIPDNAAQPDTPLTYEYLDASLPAGGMNRYLYRLRAVSASEALGAWGWASPPVRLFPNPPTRPMIAKLEVAGDVVTIFWSSNPEWVVDRYRLYHTYDQTAASDERSMRLVAEIMATDAVDPGAMVLTAAVRVARGLRSWFRLAAGATYSSLAVLPSTSSDPAWVMPQNNTPPTVPTDFQLARATAASVTVTFTPNSDPTTRYQLRRRASADGAPIPVGGWILNSCPAPEPVLLSPEPAVSGSSVPVASLTLTDPAALDPTVTVQYFVACQNDSGRVSVSDALSLT